MAAKKSDLKVDEEFRKLCPALGKESRQELELLLSHNRPAPPIRAWGQWIVDGFEIYELYVCGEFPYTVEQLPFASREEAILWICTHNALQEDLTEEQRRYLIGRRYQMERALHGESLSSSSVGLESCWKTAIRLGREYGSTPTTIQRYGVFAAAMDTIGKYAPLLFEQILAGKTQLTFAHMIALAEKKPREIKQLEDTIVRSSALPNSFRKARGRSHPPMTRGFQPTPPPPIKSMPAYDPDAEITSLTLTIPSWAHSIERIMAVVHWEETTPQAKTKLCEALSFLSQKIRELTAYDSPVKGRLPALQHPSPAERPPSPKGRGRTAPQRKPAAGGGEGAGSREVPAPGRNGPWGSCKR